MNEVVVFGLMLLAYIIMIFGIFVTMGFYTLWKHMNQIHEEKLKEKVVRL